MTTQLIEWPSLVEQPIPSELEYLADYATASMVLRLGEDEYLCQILLNAKTEKVRPNDIDIKTDHTDFYVKGLLKVSDIEIGVSVGELFKGCLFFEKAMNRVWLREGSYFHLISRTQNFGTTGVGVVVHSKSKNRQGFEKLPIPQEEFLLESEAPMGLPTFPLKAKSFDFLPNDLKLFGILGGVRVALHLSKLTKMTHRFQNKETRQTHGLVYYRLGEFRMGFVLEVHPTILPDLLAGESYVALIPADGKLAKPSVFIEGKVDGEWKILYEAPVACSKEAESVDYETALENFKTLVETFSGKSYDQYAQFVDFNHNYVDPEEEADPEIPNADLFKIEIESTDPKLTEYLHRIVANSVGPMFSLGGEVPKHPNDEDWEHIRSLFGSKGLITSNCTAPKEIPNEANPL